MCKQTGLMRTLRTRTWRYGLVLEAPRRCGRMHNCDRAEGGNPDLKGTTLSCMCRHGHWPVLWLLLSLCLWGRRRICRRCCRCCCSLHADLARRKGEGVVQSHRHSVWPSPGRPRRTSGSAPHSGCPGPTRRQGVALQPLLWPPSGSPPRRRTSRWGDRESENTYHFTVFSPQAEHLRFPLAKKCSNFMR